MTEEHPGANKLSAQHDLDTPIWGAASFGRVINRTPRQTHYLLSLGLLDADKVGHNWVSTPRRLLAPFRKLPEDAA